jgi:AbrB family looped-hinge helix DNA binding protein
MKLAQSRVTAQGQVSIPVEVRRRLGLAAGSVIEWDEQGGEVVVRRSHRYTSDDIHRELFPTGAPKPRTLDQLKDGIRERMKARHARR